MAQLSGGAFKVLIFIARKTYGFHLDSENIGLAELAKFTGLSRQGVVNGIAELSRFSLVNIQHGPKNSRIANSYSLNIDITTGQLVKQLDQSKKLTSQEMRDGLVKKVDSLKLIRETNKSTGAKAPESLPIAKHRKLTCGARIPPELQPVVSKIVDRINELAGSRYRDDKPAALRDLIARLGDGRTEAECLAVVDGRHAAWAGNDKMLEYFRPSTLFAAVHF